MRCPAPTEQPGAFSAMTRSSSRLPADRTLAKDSVEVNQTSGSPAVTRRSPRATAMVRVEADPEYYDWASPAFISIGFTST